MRVCGALGTGNSVETVTLVFSLYGAFANTVPGRAGCTLTHPALRRLTKKHDRVLVFRTADGLGQFTATVSLSVL